MAKDILVDTNSGDFLVPERDRKVQYWDVVWGKLFDGDEEFYMNIIVPNDKVNKLSYNDDGEFVCNIHVDYCGQFTPFVARFVERSMIDGEYVDLSDYSSAIPLPSNVCYYPEFVSVPQEIYASQLQMIDPEGYYTIQFRRYNGGNIVRAVIYKAQDVDFKIGIGDNQSAQLLARCAPGKFYRYPTTGVDLTKYIGSVVEHTDLSKELTDEFNADNKNIVEAEFDEQSGDLQVIFNGSNEAQDKDLHEPSMLDLELLRVADDEYIRALYKASQELVADNEAYRGDVLKWVGSLLGIWDVGSECELEHIKYTYPSMSQKITPMGVQDVENGYMVVHYNDVQAGRLYALNYPSSEGFEDGYRNEYSDDSKTSVVRKAYWERDGLFAAEDREGNSYVDDAIYTEDYGLGMEFKTDPNRRLFMVLKPCTIHCYAGSNNHNLVDEKGYGLCTVVDKVGNYSTVLAIAVHPRTGKMYGIVTLDSQISEVHIEKRSGRLLVIKQKL